LSPILVRPVREQLEHDRVIRLLQVRLKKRQEIVANIGDSQTVSVKIGQVLIFPDLVLTSSDRGHRLLGTVEVETAESVNHLEAMAQWAHLGRARAPFHLYVPAASVEIARRLAAENQVNVAEIWSFHTIGDQTRFTMIHRAPASELRRVAAASRAALAARTPRPPIVKPVKRTKSAAKKASSPKAASKAVKPPAARAKAQAKARTPVRKASAPAQSATSHKQSAIKTKSATKRK